MADHRISGVASLVSGGAAFPASITLDAPGIELFAAILHVVHAVRAAQTQVEFSNYKKHFIGSRDILCRRTGESTDLPTFVLKHGRSGRSVMIRVDKSKSVEECLSVETPTNVFVTLNLNNIRLAKA